MRRFLYAGANVLITGASSGIGAALAEEAARFGAGALFLCGRDQARLADIAERCRAAGAARVQTAVLDVADATGVAHWMRHCAAEKPLDVIFANAGVSTGLEIPEHVRETFSVNVGGVVNTVLPALELLRGPRAAGAPPPAVVITASIAGYAPLAACPSYSATKACVKTWGLSLRAAYRRKGVRVCVVCPGFVRSRITDRNTCPMPFFMEAPAAARLIWRRVARNVGLIAFPWPMRFVTWLLGILPWCVAEWISRCLPGKGVKEKGI